MSAESALLAGRAAAEALMVDTVSITRATGATTLNETTGLETPAVATVVYAGPCKVQRRNVAPQDADASARTVTTEAVELHVPAAVTGVRVGDVATVTAAVHDTELVGRRLRVTGLAHKTYATARRLRCEEVTG